MAQLKSALNTVILNGCNRLLSKGKRAITEGDFVCETHGSDAFETWSREITKTLPSDEITLPHSFSFKIHYEDAIDKTQTTRRIVLMSHGSPGSHKDFKYMTPKLIEDGSGTRVVSIDWPEHGYSKVADDYRRLYCHSTDERCEIMSAFLDHLEIPKVDVIVGHSSGCLPAIAFGADDTFRHHCKSLLLINCGGTTPYTIIQPYWLFQALCKVTYLPVIGTLANAVFLLRLRQWELKVRAVDAAETVLKAVAHAGYQQLPKRLEKLRKHEDTPRVLCVYAEDDPLIDQKASERLAKTLGCRNPIKGYERDALEKVAKWWNRSDPKDPVTGTKNLAVNFGKGHGGHFLQKRQAKFLIECVRIMSR